MKKIIFFTLILPCFLAAQQDSLVFEKVGALWYKTNYHFDGPNSQITKVLYTSSDSLVEKTLKDNINQASDEYWRWKLLQEEQEKNYLVRIRQAERQYRDFYGKKPDLDTISNAKSIIGNWTLNGQAVVINQQLKLDGANINFVSVNQFYVVWDGKRVYFFKKGDDWIADGYKLVKGKKTLK